MRRSLKQYARALDDALHTEGASVPAVVKRFVQLLAKDGVLTKTEQILRDFSTVWNTREHAIDITMSTAREISPTQQKHIADGIMVATGKTEVSVHTIIDSTLIGGARLRYHDTILDGSIRRQLRMLKEKMM